MRRSQLDLPKILKKTALCTIQILLFLIFFANELLIWTRLTVRQSHTRLAYKNYV